MTITPNQFLKLCSDVGFDVSLVALALTAMLGASGHMMMHILVMCPSTESL